MPEVPHWFPVVPLELPVLRDTGIFNEVDLAGWEEASFSNVVRNAFPRNGVPGTRSFEYEWWKNAAFPLFFGDTGTGMRCSF